MMITRRQNTEVGIILAIIMLLTALLNQWKTGYITATGILVIVIILPVVFKPFSWLWFKFAGLLEKTITPFLLSVIFYLILTPIALLRRLVSRADPLQLKKYKKGGESIFIARDHIYRPDDLSNQF